MANSSLVDYTRYSPNHSGRRKYAVTRITPHCVVGQISVERLGEIFAPTSKEASSNYGIGFDGKVGMYVAEQNRSWCSSSYDNDNRAVTIECASDVTSPYAFRDVVYRRLIELCVDICKRYGKKKLLWLGSLEATEKHRLKDDEMLLTVHCWFANKSCPGPWLLARMGQLADTVTERLNGKTVKEKTVKAETSKQKTTNAKKKTKTKKNTASSSKITKHKALGYATHGPLKRVAGRYQVTAPDGLNMRHSAGTAAKLMTAIPYKKVVTCYGFYSMVGLTRWLYVVWEDEADEWTGFVCSKYLKKI